MILPGVSDPVSDRRFVESSSRIEHPLLDRAKLLNLVANGLFDPISEALRRLIRHWNVSPWNCRVDFRRKLILYALLYPFDRSVLQSFQKVFIYERHCKNSGRNFHLSQAV